VHTVGSYCTDQEFYLLDPLKTEEDLVSRIQVACETIRKAQVSVRGCARAWGMKAIPPTNSVAVTSSSSYALIVNNTIKNRTDNVQKIATHENKTQGPILEVSPRDLPTSTFAASALISILRRCF